MSKTYESDLEEALVDLLADLGFDYLNGDRPAPEADLALRTNYHDAVLKPRLRKALATINPKVPEAAREYAIAKLTDLVFTDLVQENRRIHKLMVGGVDVSYVDGGETRNNKVRLIDWRGRHNDWLAVNQLPIVGDVPRRLDVLLYLNGIPLVLIELKGPEREQADIEAAYQQVVTYRSDLPELFRFMVFSVISDGFAARYLTIHQFSPAWLTA